MSPGIKIIVVTRDAREQESDPGWSSNAERSRGAGLV